MTPDQRFLWERRRQETEDPNAFGDFVVGVVCAVLAVVYFLWLHPWA